MPEATNGSTLAGLDLGPGLTPKRLMNIDSKSGLVHFGH